MTSAGVLDTFAGLAHDPGMLMNAPQASRQRQPLKSIRQVRELTASEVAEAPPVEISGVVVYHEPQGHRTFVCDGTHSIYVHIKPNDPALKRLEVGTLVEVDGIATAGDFQTCVEGAGRSSATLRILGHAPLPPGRYVTMSKLVEPNSDSEWIEICAIVRGVSLSANRARLDLQVQGQELEALVAEPEPASAETLPWHLVNRTVTLRAVIACIFNRDRQMTGRLLLVPSMSEVVAEVRDVSDEETLPLRPLNTLLQTGATDALGQVRIEGIVTFAYPGQGLYLRGSNIGVWVQTAQPVATVAGSVVEVIGFPAMAPFRPTLRAIRVKELRREAAPAPHRVTIPMIFSGMQHADLVTIDATLIKVQVSSDQAIFQFHASSHLFQARLNGPTERAVFNSLQPGAKVRVCGICLAKSARDLRALQVVNAFEILLRASTDLTVLATPSRLTMERVLVVLGTIGALIAASLFLGGVWTSGRTLFFLGLVGASALAALAWISSLRRRVAVLTARIQDDAIHGERLRIARDLHDDLGARVTHLGALATFGGEDAADFVNARTQFALIRDGAREIVQALDAAVWTVNPENDAIADLAIYLCQWAGDFFHPTAIRCRFDVDDNLPKRSVPITVRNEVFLAVKETLNNAARHSEATEVWLRINASEAALKIIVEDNGQGQTELVSTGFGMKNIRDRLERINGTLLITRRIEGGMAVEFSIPLH